MCPIGIGRNDAAGYVALHAITDHRSHGISGMDIVTQIDIGCARSVVAEYVANPDNAPGWYENIESVDWQTPRPLRLGSRITFTASFLGRKLGYTYEVIYLTPLQRLVMRGIAGPFPMETTYEWEDTASGGTRMTLRNRGGPAGLLRVVAPLIARAVRRENRRDVARLKRRLEAEGVGSAERGGELPFPHQ